MLTFPDNTSLDPHATYLVSTCTYLTSPSASAVSNIVRPYVKVHRYDKHLRPKYSEFPILLANPSERLDSKRQAQETSGSMWSAWRLGIGPVGLLEPAAKGRELKDQEKNIVDHAKASQ